MTSAMLTRSGKAIKHAATHESSTYTARATKWRCMSGDRQHVNTETGTVTKRNKSKLALIAMKFWEKQEDTDQEMKFLNTEYRMWK
jgi:hypothetical protein